MVEVIYSASISDETVGPSDTGTSNLQEHQNHIQDHQSHPCKQLSLVGLLICMVLMVLAMNLVVPRRGSGGPGGRWASCQWDPLSRR